MAIIRCPECGREISDKAAACPSCGAPVSSGKVAPARNASGIRTGAIVGTIGSAAFCFLFVAGTMGLFEGHDVPNDGMPIDRIDLGYVNADWFNTLGMGSVVLALLLFAAGIILAGKMKRGHAIALSAAALVCSVAFFIVMIIELNFYVLCLGWLFGWEPILMVVGGVLMISAALRIDE